jgi:polyketide synthase PksN
MDMIDFVEYVVSELRSKRLSKADALALMQQFSRRTPKGPVIHPLLHSNTSDLGQQSYASIFTGSEFFLKDHRVQGRLLLPGVAYLEMARAALSLALPRQEDATILELHNVVWAQPVVVTGPTEVAVALVASDREGHAIEKVDYEIYGRDGEQEIVHCQGTAALTHEPAPARLDVEQLKGQMSRGRLEATAVYAAFKRIGADFGPALQSVTAIHQGDQQVLAELHLPAVVEASQADYQLHPSLMDGALQASMGLAEDLSMLSGQARVPFALECLRIVRRCTRGMYAWVRYSPGSQASDKVVKLDIDLCDEQGNVCVQLRGFSTRVLSDETSSARGPAKTAGLLMAAPEWQSAAIAASSGPSGTTYAEHHIILCELPNAGIETLGSLVAHSQCLALQAERKMSAAQRYSEYALACFERIQTIVRSKPQGKVLVQIVVGADPEHAFFAGLIGLLKTAAQENPLLAGQLILAGLETTAEGLAERLEEEKASGALEPQVQYAEGLRRVLRWQEVAADEGASPIAFKEDGVYLITGGLGGLGILFAEEILRQTAKATIVLTGRSALTAAKQARLDGLSRDRVIYRQVDLGDRDQVEHLISAIQEDYRRLNGIFHAAGMIADNFILKKTSDEFSRVLAPKVIGTFNLDQASRDVALDFFVLFSSVSATMGNLGQSDYATANGFMDGLAAHRNRQVTANRRHGRTLSINWGLWQSGGMGADPESRKRVEQITGMQPMGTATGMHAFYRGLALSHDQVMVVEGDLVRLRRALLLPGAAPSQAQTEPAAAVAEMDAPSLAKKTQDYLCKQCSSVLRLPSHKIDSRAPLENYGIDSIMAMNLTNRLEETFGSLSKTLFFEYQTIAELAEYFVQSHQARLAVLFAPPNKYNQPAGAWSAPADPPSPARVALRSRSRIRRPFQEASPTSGADSVDGDPIAIIGLSGRYPEALDVETYWQNLREGKDCIVEVPRERWDWREYYSEDRNRSGHHYSKWGGFISGVDEFDPMFFNISPVEAEIMDPQERLFLQHAWMAVEDAGYTRSSLQIPCGLDLAGQVGVYAGVMYGEYQLFGAELSMLGQRMGFANNPASIANRVSYILNLHGPSMTLDTMCSSSLTAIHLACQDLKQGRTSLAIAGGVNVSIHPNKYLMVSAGQAISSDGHCQSFGQGGDGYIPAEGVGVVILKKLSDAKRDGDHVYGVIRGSAINHGGKTNGYTVPNPQAQASAIIRTLAETHTDPRHISYIEAHGTGTKLGDPIEIAALSKAFQQYTQDTEFCLIGSAKSNIGHCESAAGVAGLTKVLLQMQHQQIVPSLHSGQLNPHIAFHNTPFVVNQSLRPWEQPVIGGRTLPRIAGISSFGAGGSNAHMIVEEYQAPPTRPIAFTEVVILLSARTAEQLRQKARDLLAFVQPRLNTIDLAAVAYTLQVGREAMDERLGFPVSSAEQLLETLQAYVAGEQEIEDAHQGKVTRNDGTLSLFSTDTDLQQTIDKWIANGKFSKLLNLWVRGLELDWSKLYGAIKPQRISLPTYPFARERYWIDTAAIGRGAARGATNAVLHPLLHSNTSDLNGLRYRSTFTGEEFFLADHQVNADGRASQRVLPGVAYLEMARVAIERALPVRPESAVLELHNTVWAQPIVVSQNTNVAIALSENDEGQIDFEIYTEDVDQKTLHCQGRGVFSRQPGPARLDIGQLRARMTQHRLDADGVYAACARMGLAYGPALRGVTAIHRGSGEVLAQLRLPRHVLGTASDYVLHPSLMDSALQAAVGLREDGGEAGPPRLPFALETLRVLSPCSEEMVAWVRYSAGSEATDDVVKLDVDLCDDGGNVCVQMHGFSARVLSQQIHAKAAKGSLLATAVWQTSSVEASAGASRIEYAEGHVILCERSNAGAERLAAWVAPSHCLSVQAEGRKNIAERYREYALTCFERVQAILQGKPEGKVLVQIVITDDGQQALFAGLSGLLRTAGLENPRLIGQLILVPPGMTDAELGRHLQEEKSRGLDPLIRYQGGARQVLRWEEIAAGRETPPIAFKDHGVYLITGGLGGLGVLFAKEILVQAGQARVVLTGRSAVTAEKQALLDGLSTRAGRVSYRQVDLGDLDQVERLIAAVRDEYGQLDGILHSAGTIADNFILKKTGAEFGQVLTPKVSGTFHLDQASRDVELDFFVLFSSISGAMGNPGQADYATANGFMDQFAAYRNRQVAAGERRGRTRSINWPLWQAGGMGIDPEGRELLEQTTGMQPMRTATGLDAFYRSLALPCDQMLVAEGDLTRLRRTLFATPSVPSERETAAPLVVAGIDSGGLAGKAQDYLRKELSEVLKLPAHKIDPQAPLENYGIDSVLAMRLTNQLEKTFGSLSKTLFFEYQTIAALAGYFVRAHPAIVQEKLGPMREAPKAEGADRMTPDQRRPAPAMWRRSRAVAARADHEIEIAIVGLGGRYPQAETLQEFWRNLQDGRDCITEIPPERWDHKRYFDPDQGKAGKTYSKWGGFIAGVDQFDPLFFNISPKEAALTDPQERLFLETAWETIEDAGYTKESISGSRVGVYVGVMWAHYELFGAESILRGETSIPVSSHSSIANRVSYFFDFHGPSIALDTMCSSSLTAIHLACQELRNGEIDAAIAGGVNVTIHPYKYLSLSQGKFVASDGRCRSFGAGGDGYVPGEGVGAVLLKPLENALRDGDQVYAVIKSSMLNHGGKTNGYTVPNPNAQGDLIRQTLQKASIDPKTLGYVETHGTGTSLGDPVEITGLLQAFEGSTGEKQFCPIGSVKSNIGHLESAAGIAAVTKAVLQIKHRQLVPSLHADPLNPNINFADSPFYVQTELTEWKGDPAHPRRVGVSSFGAGGSNAHLILEEYADGREPATASQATAEVFILSARNTETLCRYAERVARFLDDLSGVSLADVAYTSQVGRTPMDARLAIVTSSVEDLRGKLNEWLALRRSGGDSSDLENVFYGNVREAPYSAAGLIEGQAGEAFLRHLLTSRDLEKIARLWTLGVDADWSLMDRPATPRRVSLPTYPFARERCWIKQETPSLLVVQENTPDRKKVVVQERHEEKRRTYYSPRWTLKALVAPEQSRTAIGPILILDETDRLFLAMREQREDGAILWVRPAEAFGELEPDVYIINPEREEHFHEIVASLKKKALLPSVVLHHSAEPCNLDVRQDVARELNQGLYSLHSLWKALAKEKHQAPPRIMSVFSSPPEATAALSAAIGAFFRTLTLEDPRVLAKAMEIQDDGQLSLPARAALIWDEIHDRDWTTQEIRYRRHAGEDQQGLVRAVSELVAHTPAENRLSALPLRQRGVYVITGGLGGLGLIFAQYLAKNFQSKLVLVGRSAPNAKREEKLAELKSYGAEVLCVQADVSKLEDMEIVVREAKAHFSEINGVLHAAGVNRDAFILKKTREEMEAVLAPKVYGAISVDLATRDENLDLFVLFSSVAGVLGNVGQSDYAYANHFLDSFAERREHLRSIQKRSGRTLSIDWPLWEEGGMRISPDGIALLEKRTGLCPLPTGDGIQYWENFLRSEATQGVALYGIPSRIAAYVSHQPAKAHRNASVAAEGIDSAALFARTEAYLKVVIGEEINLDPDRIDSSDRLESFGIDSVMINRINVRLERDVGELPKTLLYEYETVRDAARFLVRQAREALIGLFDSAGSTGEPIPASPAAGEDVTQYEVSPAGDHDGIEEIAIIGVHARYPHSANLDEYWDNLKHGRELIDLVPPNRWDYEELYHPDPAAAAEGKIYCKWGGFLDDHDRFDPRFFRISTAEARIIDPQERLFLESVWTALEDAGYTRDRLRTRFPKAGSADVGVFVGVTTNSYHLWAPEERMRGNFMSPGAMPWSIANRVSYFFDFNGPSLPVDTACSSSLVAIHLACESLRNRECQMAIAGGVNLYLHPSKYHSLCQRRMVSLDGKCHSFGAGDDGFVPGEGVGTLVLKPLRRAIEDRDRIYAVIRASAWDHSGRSNGYSAPNPNAQANLISHTLEKAGVHPETIGYVEGHGTGTQLGDSIEIAALTQAFQRQTTKKRFCPIGSVKANIGHSESAAGIAGLAKVILQMEHGQLAPSIHSEVPNPNIDFEESPFYLQHGLSEWDSSADHPRRALINSFGAGGVNACVVIEEYEKPQAYVGLDDSPYLFALSARTEDRLREYADRLLTHLRIGQRVDLAGLCYTLQVGREAMEERLAIVVSDVNELIHRLSEWSKGGSATGIYRGSLGPRRGSKRSLKLVKTGRGEPSLVEVASKWAAGEEVDWESLYSGAKPRRISAPTYPFARERYWVSDSLAPDSPAPEGPALSAAHLHPLIAYNSSTFKEVSFSSSLPDTAFYAVDHQVHDEKIFPGAGFLEMACIAGNMASEERVRKIKDIVWNQPLSFRKGPQRLRTLLKRVGDCGEYDISSFDDENEPVLHSEGRLEFSSGSTDEADAEERVPIQALKEQCARPEDGAAYYEKFRKYGLNYGPSFQTIQELYVAGSFALSRLKIADHLKAGFGQFILHPSMIDGALQTAAGLLGGLEPAALYLPFALDEVEIVRPVAQTCYAHAEFAGSREQNYTGARTFNIRLLSERGEVLIRFRNLIVRSLAEAGRSPGTPVAAWPAAENGAIRRRAEAQ